MNLKDNLEIRFARLKRSLELFELRLGLAVMGLMKSHCPLEGFPGQFGFNGLSLPQFPLVDKAPWVRRHIPKHIESALHILEAMANAVTAEAGRGRC